MSEKTFDQLAEELVAKIAATQAEVEELKARMAKTDSEVEALRAEIAASTTQSRNALGLARRLPAAKPPIVQR